ncbi:MAG: hypothetical protein A4E25_02390 [Methanobacterium sp. PtaB.Bin024]|nr:MAG: hypothetical protein A4E25_02390 [Methanobacterium sp. PtaB.Bin024]
MKKIYVVLLIILLTPVAVYAWNDCPYGLLNDPFPGQCPRYTDTNHDSICDHSQSPTSASTNNTQNLNNNSNENNNSNNSSSDIQKDNSVPSENYYLIPVAVSTTIIYLVTYLLYLENMLKKKIFYKIWNYVLIASFILTGLTGLIMIIIVNYGIGSSWNLTIDFWHAEFAIIMAVSTIIHFHLYWKPLKKVFTG